LEPVVCSRDNKWILQSEAQVDEEASVVAAQ
jgi:hypothetical protein